MLAYVFEHPLTGPHVGVGEDLTGLCPDSQDRPIAGDRSRQRVVRTGPGAEYVPKARIFEPRATKHPATHTGFY